MHFAAGAAFVSATLAAAFLAAGALAAPPDSPAASAPSVRDGSRDFDFIYGKWRMPNHRLKKRLADSHEWADFITCDEGGPLPGGIGDTDYWRASYWQDFVGVTFRTYDPKAGLWRIYWVDNRFSEGAIGTPVIGKFEGNVGIFEGPDTYNGKPVTVRYTWRVNPAQVQTDWEKLLNPNGARVVAKWEQALSADGGKTWETNWYNEFIHDDNCAPTS
jgi:hypothetical protein